MKKMLCFVLFLLIIGIPISGCGGGGGIVPATNSNSSVNPANNSIIPTPTPALVQKPASGILLVTTSVTDSGDSIANLNVLDVPATKPDSSGNVPFLQQVGDTLKADPKTWNSSDIQELYNRLNFTLSQSQPLPVYNSQAKVYSSYDSQCTNPIAVSSDGSFNSQLLTNATSSTAGLDVYLNDDTCLDTETVLNGGISASCDTTPGLKACPSRVEVMPGEISIIHLFACPATNLKEAGLTLSLANPEIGCITPFIYLNICGQNKYTEAYFIFYAKKNIGSSPVLSKITASTNSGLKVEVPVEIVKSTASISGTVYIGGSQLVKGFVKAYGPNGFCKIDASGNYSLPRVFKAHNVKVTATYWTIENGKQVRHRQERVIDFLPLDATNFNFGDLPPTDLYYDYISNKIIGQKLKWQQVLGREQGIQKTVDWLNNKDVSDTPLPAEIAEAIEKAEVDEYDPSYEMCFYFKSGLPVSVSDRRDLSPPITPTPITKELSNKDSIPIRASDSQPMTTKNSRILMLLPLMFNDTEYKDEYYSKLKSYLVNDGYDVTYLGISDFVPVNFTPVSGQVPNDPSKATIRITYSGTWLNYFFNDSLVTCEKIGTQTVIGPQNFEHMDQYGVIFIDTHGLPKWLMACPYYKDPILDQWLTENKYKGVYKYSIKPFNPMMTYDSDDYHVKNYKGICISTDYLVKHNNTFNGSLVCINACFSMDMHNTRTSSGYPFEGAQVYLGNIGKANSIVAGPEYYYFFRYMLGIETNVPPMSAIDAFTQTRNHYTSLIDCYLDIDTGHGVYSNTYFPASLFVTVHK